MHRDELLLFLRDAFTGLSVALYCQHAADGQCESGSSAAQQALTDGTLAAYVLTEVNTTAVVPLRVFAPACAIPPVCLGTFCGDTVYLAVPLTAATFAGATLTWARYAQTEAIVQYMARCRIAQLQTIGGGWASLCRADRALVCAIALYHLATEVIHDADIASKSRVFIGWAHLWNGNVAKAMALFKLELQDALDRADIVHERRCRHAIINATTNAQLLGSLQRGAFSLTNCWTNAFSASEIQEVDDLTASLEAAEGGA